ncbi:hypothetical protein [Sphingomonas aerolata]|uniref:hypothetical protein n=1 Tax=Sphingomonas aerolata TaxID=185951 RepID=UPI00208F7543|nr:hypothetical protein [Sphingomonas aerolata]USQ99520.1 hypothetical protein NEF64_14000 [Sphingomonas aerolata]
MNTPYRFVTADEDFIPETIDNDFNVTGTIVSTQNIPQSFLDSVAAKRAFQDRQSFSALTKGDEIEKIHLARIPVAVVSKWQREGFDLFQAIHEPNGSALILAKLRAEDLTAFQTTSKTF